MDKIAIVGYGLAAAAMAILLLLLLSSWRGRLTGGALVAAVAVNCAWAILAAASANEAGPLIFLSYRLAEAARYLAWLGFMFHLLSPLQGSSNRLGEYARHLKPLLYSLATLTALAELLPALFLSIGLELRLAGYLGLALGGLVLTEQLYRQTRPEERWAIKFLCLSLATMFAYDFYLYSDALLFQGIDATFWAARGYVAALAVPLLAVTVARNPTWSIQIFVSRAAVIRSASVLAAGIYLLLMAGSGYYIKLVGGDWAEALQVVFVAAALVALALLAVSGQMRARIKVFFNKHFFNYKYDYREEWLRFIGTVASPEPGTPLYERVIRAMADIVDSPGGMLWLQKEHGHYVYAGHANRPADDALRALVLDELATWMAGRGWIVELEEYRNHPEHYAGLQLPEGLKQRQDLWLLVPLHQDRDLIGIIMLVMPRAPRAVIWEDRDLLKTAGRQIAGYLALSLASEALAQARQFEAFNRLSAFVVHDLKNIVAQLSLLVKNAERHKANPAFIEDAFATVANASDKMERMLGHLRKGTVEESLITRNIELGSVLSEVVKACAVRVPIPSYSEQQALAVRADRDKLSAILVHLIENAQEATPPDGFVRVSATLAEDDVIIEVADNGAGMDEAFVRERLFRPFDTTKGNAGMGIGVFQSRETVRSFGGELTVDSAPGRGTRFYLRLARAASNANTLDVTNTDGEVSIER